MKLTVKYEDYKQFKADTTITFGDEVKPDPKATNRLNKAVDRTGKQRFIIGVWRRIRYTRLFEIYV